MIAESGACIEACAIASVRLVSQQFGAHVHSKSSIRERPTSSPQPTKGELSGVALLEVSASLFRERGYAATTMRAIAQAAGMKAASLYYHFESKDQILERVLEHGISEAVRGFREALAGLPADTSFEAKFRAVVAAHLHTVIESGVFTVASRQLLHQVPAPMRERHLEMRGEYGVMWRRLLDEGVIQGEIAPESDISLISLFLLGSLNWANEWADPKRKSLDDLSAIAANVFLTGLKNS